MTKPMSEREPIDCARLRRSPLLQAYLDEELPVADMLDIQVHLDRCPACACVLEEERALRRRLRERLTPLIPSNDLRERLRRKIFHLNRRAWAVRYFRWAGLATLGSAAAVVLLFWGFRIGASAPDLVQDLVSNHRVFSRLEAPAELASNSRLEVAGWIRRQLAMSVPVPDFGQAGLRLIGVRESAGHQVVLGRSGRFVFALVSTIDREALLECARTFLREGRERGAGAKVEPT